MVKSVVIFRHNLFEPSETFIRDQAAALKRYSPRFVARRPIHDNPENLEATSFWTGSKASDLWYGFTGRSAAADAMLSARQPDLLHAHFGPDGLYASRIARRLDIPLVVTLHGNDVSITRSKLLRSARPVAVQYALQRTRSDWAGGTLVCVSEELRRQAIRVGFPESATRLSYIGVDTQRFELAPWPRPPVVTHVARLVEKKGTTYLIDAFALVVAALPEARLRILGAGPLAEQLVDQVERLGLGGHVEFLGRVTPTQVMDAVGASSVFALPSVTAANGDREGLPISILEAMSLGTPVVATRHSGIPEAINSEDVGLLVGEREPGQLADALVHFLGHPGAAESAGLAARERVVSTFDLKTRTEGLELIYDEARSSG